MRSIFTILYLSLCAVSQAQSFFGGVVAGNKYNRPNYTIGSYGTNPGGGNDSYTTATQPIDTVVVYPATADYYVSSSASGSGDGTSLVNAWTPTQFAAASIPAGSTIGIPAGDSISAQITIPSSGSSGNPIVLRTVGTGKRAKIYASDIVTGGWTNYSGNIYYATVTSQVYQVFLNNKRVRVAREPDTGYYTISSTNGSTTVTGSDISGSIDYTGGSILVRSVAWKFAQAVIASSSSNTVTTSTSLANGVNAGEGYVLMNKLELLDSPGEWYWDSSNNRLYVWTPNSDNPSSYTVRATTRQYGVYMSAKTYVELRDLNIRDAYDRGVFGNNSTHITIDNCIFQNNDSWAIRFSDGSCSYETITNNQIYDTNGSGMLVYASNSTMQGNTIKRTSMFDKIGIDTPYTSSGIESVGGSMIVRRNRIDSVGYNGVWFRDGSQQVDSNYFSNTCMVLDDGGAIYTWSSSPSISGSSGSVISDNIIVGSEGNLSGYTNTYTPAYAIYIDQNIHDVTITRNSSLHCNGGLIVNSGNGALTVTYNTFMDQALGIEINPPNSGGTTISNNTIYATDSLRSYVWWTNNNQRLVRRYTATPTMDYNTYVAHYNSTTLFDSNADGYFETFANWKSVTGQDSHSTCDVSGLSGGQIGVLFYNATNSSVAQDLSGYTWKDITNSIAVSDSTLAPYSSMILIRQ